MTEKILVIRFSSFGDIIQTLSVIKPLREKFPNSKISLVTKSEFQSLVSIHPDIDHIYSFDKKLGLFGFLKFLFTLRKEKFTHIYDAHKNVRSFILKEVLVSFRFTSLIVRPKDRLKRFLLFNFHINKFPWPFKGMLSYLAPLVKWGIKTHLRETVGWKIDQTIKDKISNYRDKIVLAPSAAWEMKRWPISHFIKLVELLPNEEIILLGGPSDTFLEEIKNFAPNRITNLAGKLSLIESCALVLESRVLISADTGMLHVGDLFSVPSIALIGPTAFGFPSNKKTQVLEVDLPCRPCTKDGSGKCSREIYQQCMVDITPEMVTLAIKEILQ